MYFERFIYSVSLVNQWPVRAKCVQSYWYGLVIEGKYQTGTRLGQFPKLDCGDRVKVSDDCYISCWKLLVSEHIHCRGLRKYRYYRVKCAVLHLLSNNPRVVCVFKCERFKSLRASCLRPVWEVSVLGRLTCGIASLAELHFFCS